MDIMVCRLSFRFLLVRVHHLFVTLCHQQREIMGLFRRMVYKGVMQSIPCPSVYL